MPECAENGAISREAAALEPLAAAKKGLAPARRLADKFPGGSKRRFSARGGQRTGRLRLIWQNTVLSRKIAAVFWFCPGSAVNLALRLLFMEALPHLQPGARNAKNFAKWRPQGENAGFGAGSARFARGEANL